MIELSDIRLPRGIGHERDESVDDNEVLSEDRASNSGHNQDIGHASEAF